MRGIFQVGQLDSFYCTITLLSVDQYIIWFDIYEQMLADAQIIEMKRLTCVYNIMIMQDRQTT